MGERGGKLSLIDRAGVGPAERAPDAAPPSAQRLRNAQSMPNSHKVAKLTDRAGIVAKAGSQKHDGWLPHDWANGTEQVS